MSVPCMDKHLVKVLYYNKPFYPVEISWTQALNCAVKSITYLMFGQGDSTSNFVNKMPWD
jgi:hypothetical protein